jgi:hypothetical protein
MNSGRSFRLRRSSCYIQRNMPDDNGNLSDDEKAGLREWVKDRHAIHRAIHYVPAPDPPVTKSDLREALALPGLHWVVRRNRLSENED